MALDPGMQNLQMPQASPMGGGVMNGGGPMGAQMGGDPGDMQAQPSTNAPPQQMQNYGDEAGQGYDDDSDPQEEQQEAYIDYALSQANLAKGLRKKTTEDGRSLLEDMGAKLVQAYIDDEQSRQKWMEANEEWMKLALLTREAKTWPWPRASNVKYPLIATAAMQFSARAYPALVPSDGNIVKAKVTSVDQQGQLQQAAIRVSKHMSYQLACEVPNWEEEMDKLLMTIAVTGICFKKTYYDKMEGELRSSLVYPENLCVNYWAKSLEKAYRKTEILHYTDNEIQEKIRNNEEFLKGDYPRSLSTTLSNSPKEKFKVSDDTPVKEDEATPHVFLAVHTFWDLDGDGYEEPYIVTIHRDSQKVVRVVARWDSDGVKKDDKGKIIKIIPVEYFTDFPFIPNPDGSIYALGFGMLLGPLNETANSLINQLVDAGTLNNLQSGFLGRTLRIREGQLQLRPGEWKVLNASGDDLKNGIFPLPTKEPSAVLMTLLNMLIQSGNQLASIAEIFVGKMPGQNTPATTTQETIQQGMAVFTAIYKRVYRSLGKEFKKIFRVNRICPDILQKESLIVGQIQASDYFGTEHLIIPGADPSGDSQAMRMQKYQQVAQMMQMGTINQMVLTQRMLEGMELPNYQELMAQPQPPAPDPKAQTEQLKQQTEQLKQQGMQKKAELDSQAKQQDMAAKQQQSEIDRMDKLASLQAKEKELNIKVASQAMDAQHQRQMAMLDHAAKRRGHQIDMVTQTEKAKQEIESGQMKSAHEDAMAEAEMARSQQLHDQKMKLMKQQPKGKPSK